MSSASRFLLVTFAFYALANTTVVCADSKDIEFFERRVRPLLAKHCYECHSEEAQSREGGLLLDRESGWLKGGDSGQAVIPGDAKASLLLQAITYDDPNLQMPPEEKLSDEDIAIFRRWIAKGATGPQKDMGTTEFSQLGDQDHLFEKASDHWAFQPVRKFDSLPKADREDWNNNGIDRLIYASLKQHELEPSRRADDRTLVRRLYYDLTGLPPTIEQVQQFHVAAQKDRPAAIRELIDELLSSVEYAQHFSAMWMDIARYADTDSTYRPDTKTPYYFPFAFSYRDYVVDAFDKDKPYDQFIREQLAADLMGFDASDPEIAALGFMAVGPHANRNQAETIDDLIDLTTRGLMGITAACARCHDHKYEPVPTEDYYALHGVFASIRRVKELDEKLLPQFADAQDHQQLADYQKQRAAIDRKIDGAGNSKAKNNNRSVAQKIRETELAKLLAFHPGGPVHAMTVRDVPRPVNSFVQIRGDAGNRGDQVPRHFLTVLDSEKSPFPSDNSGRLALAEHIVGPDNPLTARVYVNRIWGRMMGSYLVTTPSDFGLQGASPTHPELLDWLTTDFIENNWSTKHLVQTIAMSLCYQQSSQIHEDAHTIDPENVYYWRANRKHLSIEALRDTMLSVSGQLDHTVGGRPGQLWEKDYTKRRAIYGFINRFNLDPTIRAYDFPSRMQTQSERAGSIVAPQALFTMNSPFVIDQSVAILERSEFLAAATDEDRVRVLFELILQREPHANEVTRATKFVELQQRLFATPRRNSKVTSPWPLVSQAILMSNELYYVD